MAAAVAAVPTIVKVASAGFSIFKGIKGLTGSKSSGSSAAQVQPVQAPSVADDSSAKRTRRIVGRNQLIQSDQKDILGNPATTSRSQLTAL